MTRSRHLAPRRRSARLGAWARALVWALALGAPASGSADPEPFPLPDALRPAVGFWKRVYLEVGSEAGLLHDQRRLGVIYEVIRFESERSERARERSVIQRREHWRRVLRRLSHGGRVRGTEANRVHDMLARALQREPTGPDYAALSRRIRFQLGQRDRFREGLVRAGAWETAMRSVFRGRGLPEDLVYLPHVESSFNVHAYSKYGAAGVWQFMRGTGRRFLRVDYVVDERLDPMAATRAAAELLSRNYESLGSWPLAITAYNHGAAGLRRAVRRLGTSEIGEIVSRYRSRRFGFASRNFYAQFLAVRQIAHSPDSYLGPLERASPDDFDEVRLPFFIEVEDLKRYLHLSPEVLHEYNPSLRPPVYRGVKRVPKGFPLRVPRGTVGADADAWIRAVPESRRYAEQHRSRFYQVHRGDSLSVIARRTGSSVSALVAQNGLRSRHRIYPGQVLEIPDGVGAARRGSRAAAARARRPSALLASSRPRPRAPQNVQPLAGPPPPAIPEDSPWRRVDGDRIQVDADETLGLLASWLEVGTRRLRALNRRGRKRTLRVGERIRLDFSRVDPETFLQRRMEFHKSIEEDFFGSYRITGTVSHRLTRGENLWVLSKRRFDVPIWLIHRFNPDADLLRLAPGEKLVIPVVESI
ncbi:MAG: transglycosylase SLT domain-containing protein [Myxococcota bacterium]